MENNMKMPPREAVTLWTAQTAQVFSCIQTQGVSTVKKEYIEKKYGDTAWVFQEAYTFFRTHMERVVPKPAGAESPIWLFLDKKWVFTGTGDYLLKLSVPKSRAVFFEREKWQKVLNLSYIGTDAADEERFETELRRMGLSSPFEAFQTPFYPSVKAKIKKSWERLFVIETEDKEQLSAALWEIRKEDVTGYTLIE